jgi:hypothetical protein
MNIEEELRCRMVGGMVLRPCNCGLSVLVLGPSANPKGIQIRYQ